MKFEKPVKLRINNTTKAVLETIVFQTLKNQGLKIVFVTSLTVIPILVKCTKECL